MNKSLHDHKMQALYGMVGITKQGHYKRIRRERELCWISEDILSKATAIRKDHPRMGCRKLYDEIGNCSLGRDRTERLLLDNGFRVPKKRNYHRTTYAGNRWYDNLITGSWVVGADRLFVSDITYIPLGDNRFYYLTLVLDVYSRKIKGWSLSDNMRTEDTVFRAFSMSIEGLTPYDLKRLVFHSDRGSQYGSDLMKEQFEATGVSPSMGGKAWENAHAESLNGIMKNEYINLENTTTPLKVATKQIGRWVYLYNFERPHGSIQKMKPAEYETYLEGLALRDKPKYLINY